MADDETSLARLRSLEQENQRLRRAVEELSILNELAAEIGSALSSQLIIERIIKRSLRAVNAEQGAITLIEPQADRPLQTLIRAESSSAEHPRFHFGQALLGWMQLHLKPLLVNDPEHDERFRTVRWDDSIRSLLSVPLMVKSELKAVLTVYNKREETGFSDNDQRLLAIIGSQSAQVLESARLYEKEKDLLRVEGEIRLASRIQAELLPDGPPRIPAFDIAGTSRAAQQVGGDYFDFIPLDKKRLVVCLGDVSGKGLPASLLMANLQATIRGQSYSGCVARECVERSNRLLYHSTGIDKFATFFYGILEPHTEQLTYCNAGHNPPLLFAGGDEPTRLRTGGMVLGVLEQASYQEESILLGPDSTLVVYSDGVTEAVDQAGQEFGEEKLIQVCRGCLRGSAEEIIRSVAEAVGQHSKGVAQSDDMTLVVIKRRS